MTPLSDQAKLASSPPRRAAAVADADAGPAERIGAFARRFIDGAAAVCTTALNRPISVALAGVDEVTAAELLRREPLPWVLAQASYARGLAGEHHVVVPRSSALVLGSALAGQPRTGDGEGVELEPAHAEAIREAVDQIFATAAASLGSLIGRTIGFNPATVQVVEDAAALPPDLAAPAERWWLIRAELSGPDDFRAELAITVGAELAREIATAGADGGAAGSRGGGHALAGIDLILDVTLPIAVELGRARMQIQDILKLAPGSIVELDKAAGDPVDILINDRPIAKGEVVVIDEHFGVRLTSIVTATERIRTLR